MKLIFTGHNDRYAIEQDLLAFFPTERPVYDGDADETRCAWVKLSEGKIYTTATTRIVYDGREGRGLSRVRLPEDFTEYQKEGLRQRALKMSFFKAAVQVLGKVPVWGSLTGVRPGKLATRLMKSGQSPQQAKKTLEKTYFVSPARARLCVEAAEAGRIAKEALDPNHISLYVGIPFCPTRCTYCSFVSQAVEKSFRLMEPYLEALMAEIEQAGQMVKDT
ncbi:MAG: coproporphyrinogen dehydrogenase HemZ, partial [Oscillospiraceae bacterium]|nr:coproporphyrinogen dehydrogenase HemZ [Oscillospiraceae bacterium]